MIGAFDSQVYTAWCCLMVMCYHTAKIKLAGMVWPSATKNTNLDIKLWVQLEVETVGGGATHEIFQLFQKYFLAVHARLQLYFTLTVLDCKCDP